MCVCTWHRRVLLWQRPLAILCDKCPTNVFSLASMRLCEFAQGASKSCTCDIRSGRFKSPCVRVPRAVERFAHF